MRGHNLPVAEPAVRMLQKQITIGKELKIMNREQLFCRIQQLGFTVDDIVLYLDTHPNCQKALAYYQRQRDLLREAREEYNRKYGPLTVDDLQADANTWTWVQQPWPWEGEN